MTDQLPVQKIGNLLFTIQELRERRYATILIYRLILLSSQSVWLHMDEIVTLGRRSIDRSDK